MVCVKWLEFHCKIGKQIVYELEKDKLRFLKGRGVYSHQFPLGSWKNEEKQKWKFSSGDFDKWVLIWFN